MVRIFIGLLLGFILGVAGAIHVLSSGRGNLQIMTSPQVHQLEEQVKQSNQQIEQLTKKLESAAGAMEKTAARFTTLEHNCETMRPTSPAEAPQSSPTPDSSATKPSSGEPSGGSVTQPAESPSPS